MTKEKIQSINWHITTRCNYRCRFCYVQKLNPELENLADCQSILQRLNETKTELIDIKKINFVGGEPFLHPHFGTLLKDAHEMGFITSIVTNGSLINENNIARLAESTDWIGISVDSASDEVETLLGRGQGNHVTQAMQVAELVHEYGMKLKVNTTVTKMTFNEDMHDLIRSVDPHRWKVFQMLHIKGQNDSCINELAVNDSQFESFKQRHQDIILRNKTVPIFESCDDMKGSYLIVDPVGNVLSNSNGEYIEHTLDDFFSDPESIIDVEKYVNRGAISGI
jgi:radical S-adenosyl methionine domain-containing protein 2